MDDNYKVLLLRRITSRDTNTQKNNLKDTLDIVQSIQYNRYKKKDAYIIPMLHDSNLLFQKAYLHGKSIYQLSQGIDVFVSEFNANIKINDPFSIGILIRGLLESYLTFFHINFAPTEEAKKSLYISWVIYGQNQRQKVAILDKTNPLYELNNQKLLSEKKSIDKNIEHLKKTNSYSELSQENQLKLIKQLKNNWKFEFQSDKYKIIGYQEILDKVGIRNQLYKNLYNHLSWSTHSTSVGLSQFADLWDTKGADLLFLNNSLIYTCSILAFMSRDVVINDSDFRIGYDHLTQDQKDLLNFYNYYFRSNDYTIDKID